MTREQIELVLADAFIEKNTNPKYDEHEFLDKFVNDRLPGVNIGEDEIELDGFMFELDRSVPRIGKYLGQAIGPRIKEIKVTGKTTNSASVEVDARNAEGGEYTYLYKKDNEGEETWQEAHKGSENTYTFNNLEANKIYNIKVKVTTKEGEIEGIVNILTGEIPEGTVTFGNVTWVGDGTASVTINTSEEGYTLQYQINGIEEGNWQNTTNGEKISGLHHKDTVYGRIYDGTNGSNEASVTITDTVVPTVSNVTTGEITENSIAVTVNAVDNETGLATSGTYKYYLNGEEKETSTSNSYTFTGLNADTEYTIKVEAYDKAGNKGEKSIVARTDKTPIYIDSEVTEAPTVGEGMTPVKWNGSNWVKTAASDKEWYNYAEKKWANVVLGDATFSGETLDESKPYSMLVWIPRYAYQITSQYHQNGSGAGNINVVFVDRNNQDKNKTKTYSEIYPSYTTGSGMSDYVVHPAFNYDGKKLAGIWVGKYETSNTNCTISESTGRYNGTDRTIQIKAGVTSWREITVSNIFTVCTNMNKSGNPYGLNTNDSVVDPHMMKNSEWGTVAYLSKSKYGKNTEEVWINPNSNFITGQAGSSVSAGSTTSTNAYNTSNGMKASTTGNVTGVYDMSGGAYEYTAAYVNNGHLNLTSYGSILVNAAGKYKDVYKVTTDNDSNNYNNAQPTQGQGAPTENTGHYGDAVWETSNNYTDSNSWYSDYSHFPYSNSPFFVRGGIYHFMSYAGVFSLHSSNGNDVNSFGFRVVVPVL